jgi:peroxidase
MCREHNRLADIISTRMPNLEDENIFQLARKILIAELQNIVYTEYLPLVLGRSPGSATCLSCWVGHQA